MATKSISTQIRQRVQDAGEQFRASDNISKYIEDGELKKLESEIAKKFEGVLDSLIIDRENDPNSKDTPHRLAKMYVHEIMRGRYYDAPVVKGFPNDGPEGYDGLLVVRAELTSLCSHHHQTVKGVAYIGIIPNHQVIGLSKYVRIAQWCARRGTLQEELCGHIADEIKKACETNNVGVYIQATHGCMENRGICAHSSLTQTTVLHGEFHDPSVKKEFFDNIALQQQFKQ